MPEPSASPQPGALVGVDIGGTAVKLGTITRAGEVIEERSIPVRGRSTDQVLGDIAEGVCALVGGKPAAVGLGVPGLLDRKGGRVIASPNLPFLDGVGVRDAFAERIGLPPERVAFENDANVAALGELWLGGARGEANFLMLTLGTGIGGGIVIDQELFRGADLAGEIGHVVVAPDGPRCGCGARGCLETLASATAARRRAEERGLPTEDPGNLEKLAELARASDGPERALLFEVGRDLGHGLGIVVSLMDVRTFVFGGGFSAALDTLEAGIRQGVAEWAYRDTVRAVKLMPATLGSSAGWIGAARLTLDG